MSEASAVDVVRRPRWMSETSAGDVRGEGIATIMQSRGFGAASALTALLARALEIQESTDAGRARLIAHR